MFVSIVIPCFNEEEVLNFTVKKISDYLEVLKQKEILNRYEIILVDDGSTDSTWSIIKILKTTNASIRGIKLAKNAGHQNALLAGLFSIEGDAAISIDADMQDDINVIEKMLLLYKDGCEIVYGVRKKRDTDTFFKRFSAEAFYKLISFMGAKIVYNHADYRLMGKKSIEHLKQFKEVNLFLRGIVPLIGYKTEIVYYDRVERFAGISKYPLKKMLSFAWEGITSFSIVPLRLISLIGVIIFFFSLGASFWILCIRFFSNDAVPGWASTALPIYFIGSIQLLSIGILGEYIGKIYYEVKQRPRYIIETTI